MQASDWAYLAGLIDGEGTIGLQKDRTKDKFPHPVVSIPSTSFELLAWCSEATELGVLCNKKTYQPHHKKSRTWTVKYQAAMHILRQVYPYLKENEKRRRAALLFQWDKSTNRAGKYTNQQVNLRQQIEKEFYKR